MNECWFHHYNYNWCKLGLSKTNCKHKRIIYFTACVLWSRVCFDKLFYYRNTHFSMSTPYLKFLNFQTIINTSFLFNNFRMYNNQGERTQSERVLGQQVIGRTNPEPVFLMIDCFCFTCITYWMTISNFLSMFKFH